MERGEREQDNALWGTSHERGQGGRKPKAACFLFACPTVAFPPAPEFPARQNSLRETRTLALGETGRLGEEHSGSQIRLED